MKTTKYQEHKTMKPIELDFNDVNDPEYTRLSLWIGNRNQNVELYIAGSLNESLSCVLSKEDAVKLAKAILENIKE